MADDSMRDQLQRRSAARAIEMKAAGDETREAEKARIIENDRRALGRAESQALEEEKWKEFLTLSAAVAKTLRHEGIPTTSFTYNDRPIEVWRRSGLHLNAALGPKGDLYFMGSHANWYQFAAFRKWDGIDAAISKGMNLLEYLLAVHNIDELLAMDEADLDILKAPRPRLPASMALAEKKAIWAHILAGLKESGTRPEPLDFEPLGGRKFRRRMPPHHLWEGKRSKMSGGKYEVNDSTYKSVALDSVGEVWLFKRHVCGKGRSFSKLSLGGASLAPPYTDHILDISQRVRLHVARGDAAIAHLKPFALEHFANNFGLPEETVYL